MTRLKNVNLCIYGHEFSQTSLTFTLQYNGAPLKTIKGTVFTVGLVVRHCKKGRELSNMLEILVKKFEGFSARRFM